MILSLTTSASKHIIKELNNNKVDWEPVKAFTTIKVDGHNPKVLMAIRLTKERHGLQSVVTKS